MADEADAGSSLPRVHHLNHFSIAMINEPEDDIQKSSLKQRKPLITADVSMESATSSIENLYKEGVLDPVYHAKTLVLNRALQEIGMGKYQVNFDYMAFVKLPLLTYCCKYMLLLVAGMGWFA